MSTQFVYLCHDCATVAEMDHMFFAMSWTTKECEFCGKRKPCVRLEAGRKGQVEEALRRLEEPTSEEGNRGKDL